MFRRQVKYVYYGYLSPNQKLILQVLTRAVNRLKNLVAINRMIVVS